MKRSKVIILIIILISYLLHGLCFYCTPKLYYENGFAVGIASNLKYTEVAFEIIYVMMHILFVLFFFNGTFGELKNGYSKLVVIRNYSKVKLMLKTILKNMGILGIIVFVHLLIFLLFNNYLQKINGGMEKTLILYFLVLNAIVCLQYLLEFFIPENAVVAILSIYSFLSYYLVQISRENSLVMKIILFPSLMYGMQNEAITGNTLFYTYLSAAIVINIILSVIVIVKFKKTDIF